MCPVSPLLCPRYSGVANLRSINPIFKHFRPLFKVSGPVMNGEKLAMLDFESDEIGFLLRDASLYPLRNLVVKRFEQFYTSRIE